MTLRTRTGSKLSEADLAGPPAGAPATRSSARAPGGSKPRVDDRAAAGRLAGSLGHALRLFRVAIAGRGETALENELVELEERIARAAVAEEYVETAAAVRGLRPVHPIAAAGVSDSIRAVIGGLRDIAHALKLNELEARLRNLAEACRGGKPPSEDAIIEVVHALALAVLRHRDSATILDRALDEVIGEVKHVAAQHEGHTQRFSAVETRLHRARDIAEMEPLRKVLLTETNELRAVVESQQRALEALQRQTHAARDRAAKLLEALEDATAAAHTDPLTGLGNRRALDGTVQAAARSAISVGLIAIDVDHFKRLNDTHGHGAGDRGLQHLSDLIRSELRPDDRAFRIGGEEILVLLAGCDLSGAKQTADRLRLRVGRTPFMFDAVQIAMTISIGVALWGGGGSFEDAHAQADAALYQAKKSGRDRVVLASG